MTQLILPTILALLVAAAPVLGRARVEQRVAESDDEDLRDLWQYARSRWTEVFLVAWAFLMTIGGLFLLARGDQRGWAPFGVAFLLVVAAESNRRHRSRLRAILDERGRVERSERYVTGRARANRWAALGFTGYVGRHVVGHADPTPLTSTGTVLVALCTILGLTGAVGWLAVRTRMWMRGYDLDTDSRS